MEIDLERARRALLQLGTALEDARQVVRPNAAGSVRVKTDDKIIELPISWAIAGAVAFLVAAVFSQLTPSIRRREREEEPLGIG